MKKITINVADICKIFLWLIFFSFIYLKYVLAIDIPRSILLLLFSIMVVHGNQQEIVVMSLWCIPLYTSFHYIYALLICIVVYALKYGKKIKFDFGILPVAFLLIWELLHCFSDGASLKDSITFIFPYIICLFLMYSSINNIDYSYVVRSLAICTIFMCLVVLSKLLIDSGFQVGHAFANMQRLGSFSDEETGAYFNPNTLGYFCILSSIGLLQLQATNRRKILDIIMTMFLLVCGILTMSKTYIVCLLIMVMLFIFAQQGKTIEKVKFIISILLIGLGIFICVLVFFPTVVDSILIRFSVEDISSGRMELFSLYNEYIFSSVKNLFFGCGLSSMNMSLNKYFRVTNAQVSHNGFQEILIVWGIPGMILFLTFLCILIKQSRKTLQNQKLINYIPLILLLIKVQAGQMITSFYTMLMFSLAYLSLCQDFDNNKVSDICNSNKVLGRRDI